MSDKKILKGIREDLVLIKRHDEPTYHRLEERPLKTAARRIHRVAVRYHPPGCQCPYHGGHARSKPPSVRGIGRRGI